MALDVTARSMTKTCRRCTAIVYMTKTSDERETSSQKDTWISDGHHDGSKIDVLIFSFLRWIDAESVTAIGCIQVHRGICLMTLTVSLKRLDLGNLGMEMDGAYSALEMADLGGAFRRWSFCSWECVDLLGHRF
jgi:hypothetical protein